MDDVKRCSKCKIEWLKTNFVQDGTMKNGLRKLCNFCAYQYHYIDRENWNLREKNRRRINLNFILAHIIRCRTSRAFKSQNFKKLNRIFNLVGLLFLFLRNGLIINFMVITHLIFMV